MSTYIAVTEAQSNPFAPNTSELIKQLRDNPIAIAQGAPGAPKVEPLALGGFFIGHVLSSTGAAIGFTDVLPVTIRAHFFVESSGGPSGDLEIRLSDDNGSNWSAWVNTMSIPGGTTLATGVVVIDMASGEWRSVGVGVGASANLSGTITGANFNAVQWRIGQDNKVYGVHASYLEAPGNV